MRQGPATEGKLHSAAGDADNWQRQGAAWKMLTRDLE